MKGTGTKDDIVEVSDGFARNCLFRKKQAIEATSTQINSVQNKKKEEEFHKAEELKKWKEVAASLNKREVTCYVRVGGNGKIFGSVTSKEISEKLNELGFDVDKKKILLKEPVKTPGNYVVDVKFLPDVTAKITVKVKTEE